MFKEFLKKIATIEIDLIMPIKDIWFWEVNTAIFRKEFLELWAQKYKIYFFEELSQKEIQLLKIQEDIQISSLDIKHKKILLWEIFLRLKKISFLRDVYDIEYQKIDPNITLVWEIDYDYYNNLFYGVTSDDLKKEYKIKECIPPNITFSKKELLELIEYSNSLIPDIKFKFWGYANYSHNKWTLNITNQKSYNLQNIISIFFHETIHFFRGYNGERNLWFRYKFENYNTLEEWIAIYNEYLYWNKLTNYWEFNPYYNICYQILIGDITETEKQAKIYKVLSCKWYNKEKSLWYYKRFYKYSEIWSQKKFLKDLVYQNWYDNVLELISEDPNNYEKIMAWNIWTRELERNIISYQNNIDSKKYFERMVYQIKKVSCKEKQI